MVLVLIGRMPALQFSPAPPAFHAVFWHASWCISMGMVRRVAAFTLVEIMIVVSIIALLAVMALPSFLRARQHAQNAKFENGLRVATDAFQMYAMEHNAYPADANRGVLPTGMALYFGPTFDWTKPTPIGGSWDWDYEVFGFTAGVSVVESTADVEQVTDIDAKIDDGDLSTGAFKSTAADRYTLIIEQ
jgi:prepilin-type N-terminal cleavage/methylation domain-containing protein